MMNPTRREALAAGLALTGGLCAHSTGADAPRLSLSTFATEITPPLGHPLMGGGVAPAKEIVDPLFAHGFVLQGVGKPVAFVALDWCEVRNGAYELFRDKISKAVDTQVAIITNALKKDHSVEVAMLRKDMDSAAALAKAREASLVEQTQKLQAQVTALEAALGKARDDAKEIAAKAFDSVGGRQAMEALQQTIGNGERQPVKMGGR